MCGGLLGCNLYDPRLLYLSRGKFVLDIKAATTVFLSYHIHTYIWSVVHCPFAALPHYLLSVRETYCKCWIHLVQDWRLQWSPPLCSITERHTSRCFSAPSWMNSDLCILFVRLFWIAEARCCDVTVFCWPRHHSCSPSRGSQWRQSRTLVTVVSLPLACWGGTEALSAYRSSCRASRCWGPASTPTSLRQRREVSLFMNQKCIWTRTFWDKINQVLLLFVV